MRLLSILFLITIYLQASMVDNIYLLKAKYFISHRNYQEAIREYLKVHNMQDKIKLNIAYCLYRDGKYLDSLNILRAITSPKLNQVRYYNMGNALVKLGRLKEALKAYRSALKFGDDEDTRSNIEIVEAKLKAIRLKEREKKETLKPIRKGKDNPDRIFDSRLKDINLTESINGLWHNGGNFSNHLSSIKGDNSDKIYNVGKRAKSNKYKSKSDISFRYWDKKMDKRGLNTLLIPLDSRSF